MSNKKYYTLTVTGVFGGQLVNVQHTNLDKVDVTEVGVTIRSEGNTQFLTTDPSATYVTTVQDGYINTTESK